MGNGACHIVAGMGGMDTSHTIRYGQKTSRADALGSVICRSLMRASRANKVNMEVSFRNNLSVLSPKLVLCLLPSIYTRIIRMWICDGDALLLS